MLKNQHQLRGLLLFCRPSLALYSMDDNRRSRSWLLAHPQAVALLAGLGNHTAKGNWTFTHHNRLDWNPHREEIKIKYLLAALLLAASWSGVCRKRTGDLVSCKQMLLMTMGGRLLIKLVNISRHTRAHMSATFHPAKGHSLGCSILINTGAASTSFPWRKTSKRRMCCREVGFTTVSENIRPFRKYWIFLPT